MKPEPDELDPVALANRRASGKRPQFFDDPAVERVLSIAMAIAGELSVTRERLDTIERLLAERGLLSAADIEAYVPGADVQAQRHDAGREYIARILRILEQDVQAMEAASNPSPEQLMDELGRPDDGRT